jgi:demethylmenaquinone methyltransferase/2-methoxy-6-polyprenyl-1,4-benzoquinol methylase
MPDPTAVRTMFARIAGRYDLANRLLSGGMDVRWRTRLVRAVHDARPRDILDLATGSGDVAFALADGLPPGRRITGVDFCEPMLEAAAKKRAGNARWAGIDFRTGDGMALPFPNNTFDAVTIAFGLRNMADRRKALEEMRRVLRPGGCLFLLEFSQPFPWFRPFYYFYLLRLSPWLAGLITGERPAYEYLGDSIERYPDRPAMSAEIRAAGFASVTATPLTFGVVALHAARSVE